MQETKHAEFHSLSLVLEPDYADSPIVVPTVAEGPGRPGHRLPHVWLGEGVSLYDELGKGLSLVLVEGRTVAASEATAGFHPAAERHRVPLTVVDLHRPDLRYRLGSAMLLVRPDQHVAWTYAQEAPTDPWCVPDRARGPDRRPSWWEPRKRPNPSALQRAHRRSPARAPVRSPGAMATRQARRSAFGNPEQCGRYVPP
ncbi:aromatic-ring hydroxylase C-terminal domain-containing protein [Streptomyces sp. B21-083]|uniref:aromatic-ring hydroxylase C-terminal domain-containing protein n=1 Tax=Streptomyces sp. B21-083 TaxID=3039410 RepID=UPI003FA765A9